MLLMSMLLLLPLLLLLLLLLVLQLAHQPEYHLGWRDYDKMYLKGVA
jgi:hypothetical protein